MNFSQQFYDLLTEKLKDEYFVYKDSFHSKDDRLFFLCRKKGKRYFCEVSSKKEFLLKNSLENIIEENFLGEKVFIGVFKESIDNSKKLLSIFPYLIPSIMDKKISVGFGDRIGIATAAHVIVSRDYDYFPLFVQQSVREITKTGKNCETVFHNAVTGIFQEGFKNKWGADADHIRDKTWLSVMLDNSFIPYTMFTIDTYDYINPEDSNLPDISLEDKNFKERLKKSKAYIGKTINLSGHKISFTEDNLYFIVRRYYKSLDFLKDCFNLIKSKIKEFDFEPTFDERDIETTPLEHFYLSSELINDGINFSTIAPKFPGLFEKGIDYIGNIDYFISSLKVHNEISKYFGNYRLSLHSADDKFSIFKCFREIIGDNFHVKTSGTTWMESLRIVAEFNPDLFKKIINTVIEKAEENSKDYYIALNYENINDLLKKGQLVKFIDIKETRQLLHVSYGTAISIYRNEIIETLFNHEEAYVKAIFKNYKNHFKAIFGK